jgi:predicted ferric reductase
MGIDTMKKNKRTPYLVIGSLFFLIIPFLYLLLADFPERTVLKESISFLTIGAFFLMLGQFYLTRINKITLSGNKFSKVINKHKAIGYIFIPILMLHPFLIVVPRFFEAGVTPSDAFKTILTTYESSGLVIGIIAMVVMILLGITSLLRKKMKISYTTWRVSHGLLSILFVILATWHAVDLGRHTDAILSTYMILMSATGIFFLLRLYIKKPQSKGVEK